MEKKFILTFRRDKYDFHEQLKQWCKDNGRIMNDTIISLAEKQFKIYERNNKTSRLHRQPNQTE